VLIHHLSNEAVKAVKAKDKRPYGSTFARAWARKLWLIEKETTETGPIIRLTNTKVNNGMEDPDLVFSLNITNNARNHMIEAHYSSRTLLDFAEARNEQNLEVEKGDAMPTVREDIASYLKTAPDPRTCKQITDALNEWRSGNDQLSEEAVRVEVKRGEGLGIFEISKLEGRVKFWALKQEGEST
tara:strand:+ start:70 stop:624 length:555 start_codon:yes stop_codon:yes gene_type:complete